MNSKKKHAQPSPAGLLKLGIVENDLKFQEHIIDHLNQNSGIEIHGQWTSAEKFWHDPQGRDLDIVLLDIALNGMSGVDLAGHISRRDPHIKMLILTNMNSDEIIFRALKYGALGYILKSELQDINAALETIISGGALITPTIALRVMQSFRAPPAIQSERALLTNREAQVLEQLACGLSPKQIAQFFGISIATIRFHIRNIYEKLNVNNHNQLTKRMHELGLFQDFISS